MKVSLITIVNSVEAVRKLSRIDLGEPILNFRFMAVAEAVEENARKYNALFTGILEKYADKAKSRNGKYNIPPQNIQKASAEIQKTDEIEIDLDWEAPEIDVALLRGFSANDMKQLHGTFIKLKGGQEDGKKTETANAD